MQVFAAYFVRSQQNMVKTDKKRISRLLRDNTKITKDRSVVVRNTARCSKLAWTLLRDGPGASGAGLRDSCGRFPHPSWHVRGVLKSLLGRLLGNPDQSQVRAGAFSKRLCASKTAHDRIFVRIRSILVACWFVCILLFSCIPSLF